MQCGPFKINFFDGSLQTMTTRELRDLLISKGHSAEGIREVLCKRIIELGILPNVSKKTDIELLEQAQCGLKTQKPENITRLLCSNVNNLTIKDFFLDDVQCSNIGAKISSNLIRVASQRIFSDPLRSFIEPIVNGIDAYAEMNSNVSIVGKFGMGFFSLLYWIIPNGNITIESVYMIESSRYCKWKAIISYNNEEFYFDLIESRIIKSKIVPGTKVTLKFAETDNLTEMRHTERISDFITNSFLLLKDYTIKLNNKIINLYPGKDVVSVNYLVQTLLVTQISFSDNATGMSIGTLLTKLLAPSISTKTIAKSLSNTLTYSNSVTHVVKQPYKVGVSSQFHLVIRGITLYYHIKKSEEKVVVDKRQLIAINQEKRDYIIYALVLADQTPLPVSRDDVILENPIFFTESSQRVYNLIDEALAKDANINELIYHLRSLANYSKDKNIFRLVDNALKYINDLPDVYTVPEDCEDFYNRIIGTLTKKKYVSSKTPHYQKLKQHLITLTANKQLESLNIFDNRIIIVVTGLFKQFGFLYTTAGQSDILFVDTDFTRQDNWSLKLLECSPIYLSKESKLNKYNTYLSNSEITKFLPKNHGYLVLKYLPYFYDIIVTINSRETVEEDYVEGEDPFLSILVYLTKLFSFSVFISDGDESYLEKIVSIAYSSLSHISMRIKSADDDPASICFQLNYRDFFYNVFSSVGDKCDSNVMNVKEYRENDLYVDLDYMLNYVWTILNIVSRSNKNKIIVYQPYFFTLINFAHDGDYDISAVNLVAQYIIDKPFAIGFIIRIIYRDLAEITNTIVTNVWLDFIVEEVTVKLGLEVLNNIITEALAKISESGLASLMNNLRTGLKLLSGHFSKETHIIQYHSLDIKYTYHFTAQQLIGYLYTQNVKLDRLDWLSQVANFQLNNTKLQALEIAVNEGTSKSFIEAVITELTQNSIDAAKQYLTTKGGVYCFRKDFSRHYVSIEEGKPKSQIYTGNREPNIMCPDILEIEIGKYKDAYAIRLTDYVGIPDEGIIAMLLPFYSTKSAKEVNSTGEMGTGFMNVFRQPYCKEVQVETSSQGRKVMILMKPIKDLFNRVIDIDYKLAITEPQGYNSTIITVVINQ